MEPLESFITTPLDCNKATFLNIKMHSILDRKGSLLYAIYTGKNVGGGGLQ